jgi:hypothetical protein
VRLEDSSGQIVDAYISVRAGAQDLAINPTMVVLELSASPFKFIAIGGTGTYTFSIAEPGAGSINPGTGDYTPDEIGTATVVVDDTSTTAEASVTVVATVATPLVIIPRSVDIKMGSNFQFSAEGGVPPYSYSVEGYGGTISASGLYTAPDTRQGVEKVRVTDLRGISDTATVKVKR